MATRLERHLARIAKLTEDAARIETLRETEIAKAVAAGATWRHIAHALAVTPQGAHKRYRHLRHDPATGATWHEPPLPLEPPHQPPRRAAE